MMSARVVAGESFEKESRCLRIREITKQELYFFVEGLHVTYSTRGVHAWPLYKAVRIIMAQIPVGVLRIREQKLKSAPLFFLLTVVNLDVVVQ